MKFNFYDTYGNHVKSSSDLNKDLSITVTGDDWTDSNPVKYINTDGF